jgi:hypothetical protein
MSARAARPIEVLLVDDDENDVLMMREALRAARSSTRIQVLSDGSAVIPSYVTKPIDLGSFLEAIRKIDEFFITVVRLPPPDPRR